MSNTRISELPEKQIPTLSDLVPIVDTQDPTNLETKRTTVGAILELGGGGGGGGNGATGPAGPTGPRGATGPQGVTGVTGATGPAGIAGVSGATGPQGATGVQGIVGITGATGPQGPAGSGVTIKGTASSYPPAPSPAAGDMWLVANPLPEGFPVGTASGDGLVWSGTEWVNVGPIRGPQGVAGNSGATGPQGAQGVTGATGPIGATGPEGATGPQGETGPAGADGADGVGVITAGLGEGSVVALVTANNNTVDGDYSSVLSGQNNDTNEHINAHIIGSYIAAVAADTTHVNNLVIYGMPDPENEGQFIQGGILLRNFSGIGVGAFNNMTGGQNGISLICTLGYELNWQGGRLRSVNLGDISGTPQPIYVESPLEFPGPGEDYVRIDAEGIRFSDGTTQTTAASISGIDGGTY